MAPDHDLAAEHVQVPRPRCRPPPGRRSSTWYPSTVAAVASGDRQVVGRVVVQPPEHDRVRQPVAAVGPLPVRQPGGQAGQPVQGQVRADGQPEREPGVAEQRTSGVNDAGRMPSQYHMAWVAPASPNSTGRDPPVQLGEAAGRRQRPAGGQRPVKQGRSPDHVDRGPHEPPRPAGPGLGRHVPRRRPAAAAGAVGDRRPALGAPAVGRQAVQHVPAPSRTGVRRLRHPRGDPSHSRMVYCANRRPSADVRNR